MRPTGVAQSFLESVNASIAPKDESPLSPVLHAASGELAGACECCCHCGRGAKIGRKVTKRSKSYTTLRTGISELTGWDLDLPVKHVDRPVQKKQYAAGDAPIEKLPSEVLGELCIHVTEQVVPC